MITWRMIPNDDRTKWLAQVFFAASGNQLGVVIVPAEHEGRLMVTDLTRMLNENLSNTGEYSRLQQFKNSYGFGPNKRVRFVAD